LDFHSPHTYKTLSTNNAILSLYKIYFKNISLMLPLVSLVTPRDTNEQYTKLYGKYHDIKYRNNFTVRSNGNLRQNIRRKPTPGDFSNVLLVYFACHCGSGFFRHRAFVLCHPYYVQSEYRDVTRYMHQKERNSNGARGAPCNTVKYRLSRLPPM